MGRRGQHYAPRMPNQLRLWHGEAGCSEDHGNVSLADQHDCKRSFRAFAHDGVDLFVFEQGRRQATQFGVVLDR